MLFNSYAFILFFGAVLGVYYAPLPWRGRKLALLLAGYVFYASYNPPFIVLLWLTTLLDWFVAHGIHRSTSPGLRKALLAGSLVINLGLLAVFKYGRFALANVTAIGATLGVDVHPTIPSIVLPVGISFYTFQSMAYAIDVYRRKIEPATVLLDYALFVAFFPVLVAGPIVRAEQFLPQAAEERRAGREQIGWGLAMMTLGMFEKVALADGLLAPIVDRVFTGMHAMGVLDAWAGSFAFAGQILFDFAGYSTCAIGAALCLGFHVRDNFLFPYASIGFSDFWRRWHVSLSSWLRDYLYISLGGNRRGPVRTSVNLMITMLLGGLWHGASWSFVVWGGLHGLFLCVERALQAFAARRGGLRFVETRPVQALLGAFTFACVCVTWVFFRADSLDRAKILAGAMLGKVVMARAQEHLHRAELVEVLSITAALLGVHAFMRNRKLEDVIAGIPAAVRAAALTVMIVLIALVGGKERAFIYFQF